MAHMPRTFLRGLICFGSSILLIFTMGVGTLPVAQAEPQPIAEIVQARAESPKALMSPEDRWIGIVGDSSSTGANSDPRFEFSISGLSGILGGLLQKPKLADNVGTYAHYPAPDEFNISPQIITPMRIPFSQAESIEALGKNKIFDSFSQAKGALHTDVEEYTWGYLIGKKWQVPEKQIWFVGQNGTRVSSLGDQFKRFFATGRSHLPSIILVSFVANDFCSPETIGASADDFKRLFTERLVAAIQQTKNLKPHPHGTQVFVLAPLDVAEVLTNHDLLAQRVPFQGAGQVACSDIRQGVAAKGEVGKAIQGMYFGMCRGLLHPSAQTTENYNKIRSFQNIQTTVWQEQIEIANQFENGIRWILMPSTREITFKSGDLANDCFHPGVGGHTAIARQLLSHELRDVKP